jgi:hypothetical protein
LQFLLEVTVEIAHANVVSRAGLLDDLAPNTKARGGAELA